MHQLVQSPLTVSVWSASQSSIVKEFETTRVPGFMVRIFGRSLMLISGSRNIVMTVGLREVRLVEVGLHERRLGA